MDFKTNVKKLRKEYNYSQEDLAKRLGIARSSVANYENGQNFPNMDILIKLSEIFNCTVDYLMGKSYYKNYDEFRKIDELVLNYKRTPEETKIIAETLNYINQNKNISIGEAIDKFTNGLSYDKINILKSIINHLNYRYHGKLPQSNNNFSSTSVKFIEIPIIGKIAAGKPVLAQEYIEGYLPVDPNIYGITSSEDYFYLRVSGNSMNQKVKNGDYALIHKQDYAENGDIIVAIVNGDDEATLKKYKKINDDLIALEPQSDDDTYETIYIDKNTNFQIIGKAIGQFGKF